MKIVPLSADLPHSTCSDGWLPTQPKLLSSQQKGALAQASSVAYNSRSCLDPLTH